MYAGKVCDSIHGGDIFLLFLHSISHLGLHDRHHFRACSRRCCLMIAEVHVRGGIVCEVVLHGVYSIDSIYLTPYRVSRFRISHFPFSSIACSRRNHAIASTLKPKLTTARRPKAQTAKSLSWKHTFQTLYCIAFIQLLADADTLYAEHRGSSGYLHI